MTLITKDGPMGFEGYMDASEQIELLEELLGLRKDKTAFLDKAVEQSSIGRYADPGVFEAERTRIFRATPLAVAHISELSEDGDFLRCDVAGSPILLTRDRDGGVHGFYNICRHRGARLVEAEKGCRHRFTCPYHAWTWDNQGYLIGVPHQSHGFPDLDKDAYGLKRVNVAVRFGWVWVQLDGEMDIDAFLAPVAEDLNWLRMDDHVIFASDTTDWKANWKIIAEGGLESYHFRVAHANTVGGLFHDNLSSYQMKGPHIRSVLARNTIDELVEKPRDCWRIRQYTNVLYSLFPNISLLVQSDHIAIVMSSAISHDLTRMRIMTLVPKDDAGEDRAEWWGRNHGFTMKTLNEDFLIGEAIQSGLTHGANDALTFGRFEGALHAFNEVVDARLT